MPSTGLEVELYSLNLTKQMQAESVCSELCGETLVQVQVSLPIALWRLVTQPCFLLCTSNNHYI